MAVPFATFGTLASAGYALQKNSHDNGFTQVPKYEMPMDVTNESKRRALKHMKDGVAPNTDRPFMGHYSHLAGRYLTNDEFTHNNMMPFYGSKVRQNMKMDKGHELLENFTGVSSLHEPKKEQKSMYDMSVGRTTGMPMNTEFMAQRMNVSQVQTGVFPLEPVRVGKGLGQGYTAEPSGGFQQANTREYAMPKSYDELRKGSLNAKAVYTAQHNMGAGMAQRGMVVAPENRKVTFADQGDTRMLPSTGSSSREARHGEVMCRQGERDLENVYIPPPTKATAKMISSYNIQDTRLRDDSATMEIRNNMTMSNTFNPEYDYGLSSIEMEPTTRETFVNKSRPGNLTSMIKSFVAPLTDILRPNKKELYVQPAREFNNLDPQIPEKAQIKSTDVARTTLKETQLHDTPAANLKGATKVAVHDPSHTTRTTIKETTIHDIPNVNLKGPTKVVVHDPSHKTRTTTKETIIHDTRTGNLAAPRKCVYVYDATQVAKATGRETLDKVDNTINLKGPSTGVVYDRKAKTKVTTKETTICAGRRGGAQAANTLGGYVSANVDAKITNRQFTEQTDYIGIADNNEKTGAYLITNPDIPMTKKDVTSNNDYYGTSMSHLKAQMNETEEVRINDTKELLLENRVPCPQGVKEIPTSDGIEFTQSIQEVTECTTQQVANKTHQICHMKEGEITRERPTLIEDSRLDPTMLAGLETNPFVIK